MKLIAELCQNHNGNTDIMLKMVEEAAKAGATHVKLQHIFADNLSYRSEFEEGYTDEKGIVRCIKRPYLAEYNRLKSLELDEEVVCKFINECKNQGVIPLTTCFAREHCAALWDLGFKSIKVASYDCSSFQLLRDLCNYDWDLIVSTGATFDNEIKKASSILKGKDFDLLHCITLYPTPLSDLNLRRMNFLKKYCDRVGFSDHTNIESTGILASVGAIYFGAEVIERHFTILDPSETRDGPVSVNPEQLKMISDFAALDDDKKKSYIKSNVPQYMDMLGKETRELSNEELLNRKYYRGRFASRNPEKSDAQNMIYNWEEIAIK
tara:strand:- start:1892 stop:2860 length:969 start_codon:yes stop_codon:yes gene_type:complete